MSLPPWVYPAAAAGGFVLARMTRGGGEAVAPAADVPLEFDPLGGGGQFDDGFGGGDNLGPWAPDPWPVYVDDPLPPPGVINPGPDPLAPGGGEDPLGGGSGDFTDALTRYPADSPQAIAIGAPDTSYLYQTVYRNDGSEIIGLNPNGIQFSPNSARAWWERWFASPFDLTGVAPTSLPGSLVLSPAELARAQAINNAGGLPPAPSWATPVNGLASPYSAGGPNAPTSVIATLPYGATTPSAPVTGPAPVTAAPAPAAARRPMTLTEFNAANRAGVIARSANPTTASVNATIAANYARYLAAWRP